VPSDYAYTRYLAAKRTVDDRALHRGVAERLRRELAARGDGERPPAIVELGGGIGTMVARLHEWALVPRTRYTLLDEDARLLADARLWLGEWAAARGVVCAAEGEALRLVSDGGRVDWTVRFARHELGALLAADGERDVAPGDLLIANAFLDLVDVPAVLPRLFARLLAPGGLWWFTINFDGETLFEPAHPDDAALISVYHRSMDERTRDGRPAGDSRTGRRLFGHLRAAGATILEAGASDWVVFADERGRYRADEAEFLRHILRTIDDELRRHAEVDPRRLAAWLEARARQLDAGELAYVAHQLDFVGRPPPVNQ
jgi:hypothetical protein